LTQIRKGVISAENAQLLRERVGVVPEQGLTPTKLFPVRAKADYINHMMYNNIKEKEYVFPFVQMDDCLVWLESGKPISPEELVNCNELSQEEVDHEITQLMSSANRPKELRLKRGARVMCTYNVDLDLGICNGSQGTIIDMEFPKTTNVKEDCLPIPVVMFDNRVVMKMKVQYWQSSEYPCIAVGQIPLCLAYALTIHKIQGATLSLAEIDVGTSIFEDGQTYVALSRVKSLSGLYLTAFHPDNILVNENVIRFYKKIEDYKTSNHHVTPTNNRNTVLDFESYMYRGDDSDSTVKKIRL
jgi:ATP-dependent DNA helicase PIF1